MTDEEVNRKFGVVADHLAGLAVGLQSLREVQARAEQRLARTEENIRALLSIAEMHEREIMALGTTLAETQSRTDAQIAETKVQMAETDERLNALINTVERYISERRNGESRDGESSNGESQ